MANSGHSAIKTNKQRLPKTVTRQLRKFETALKFMLENLWNRNIDRQPVPLHQHTNKWIS